jgi:hypothetical protein
VGALTGCGLRVGAYANGFTRINAAFLEPGATVDVLQKRKDLDPEAYAGFAAVGSPEGSALWAAAARWGRPISRFWQNDSSPMQEFGTGQG